jgi:hypothetical protein
MGWLDRIKSVPTPDARVSELRQELEKVRALRIPLYLNEHRTAQLFVQRRANVSQLVSGGGIGVEFSGGAPGIITAKGSGTSTATETIEVTPLMQALLLEEAEQEREALVDLAEGPPKPGELLRFVGASHIFGPWEPISAREDPPAIDADAASRLQAYREQQESRMKFTDPDLPGTMVWYALGQVPLASIGSMRAAEGGALASYGRFPPFGILAVLEGQSDGFELLAPLMIWHDPPR